MKKLKRTIAALSALVMTASLVGCGGSSGDTPAATNAATEAETTTAPTVTLNTETLAEEDKATIQDVADMLPDEELENKTIKWFSFYDPFNASSSGNSKALSLELFESKYGGSIEYVPTTWATYFSDLSTNILGDMGIDFTPGGDLDAFPKGVPNGQFVSYDEYVDFSSELWSPVKKLNDQFELKGKHYVIAIQATSGEVVIYNKNTIEANGFDDPAELLEDGEWTWSTFKDMLLTFVDEQKEQYGLDGWFNEKPLMLTGGTPPVELKDGKLVHNLYDENLEKTMDFMYDLNMKGLVLDKNLFEWTEHPEFIGEGKELFYICGSYVIEGSPEIWTQTFGQPEDVMFVPVPKSDYTDEYYLPAGLEAYMLCKGASNPVGVARFMDCVLAANQDPGVGEIAEKKQREDNGWTDEMIEMRKKVNELTAEHPVYSLHIGCPTDLCDLLDSGEFGIRAAFYGHDWHSIRDELVAAVDLLTDEFNASLDNV